MNKISSGDMLYDGAKLVAYYFICLGW